MFQDKVAVVTGGAQGIGRCIAGEFRKNGARVCVIDKQPCEGGFVGDIADEAALRRFADPDKLTFVLAGDRAKAKEAGKDFF